MSKKFLLHKNTNIKIQNKGIINKIIKLLKNIYLGGFYGKKN